jgi:hypothetical protein
MNRIAADPEEYSATPSLHSMTPEHSFPAAAHA